MLISVIVGVTNIIPFFGPFIGAVPCALLILMVNPMQCLYFIIFIWILQQFDGLYLGPKILGDQTGIKPLWVIFGITVGGAYFGVMGMFLGVPVVAVIMYLLLDTFATFMGLRIVDYFMQSISATTISIIIVSFVFALFGVSDFNNKRKG